MEKLQKRALYKRFSATFLVTLMIMLISISTISAMDWDNRQKVLEKVGTAGYNDIEIGNIFGLGKTLWSGTLNYNSNACSKNCEAIQTIELKEKGSLIDDIKFETIKEDKSRTEQNIKSYQIYINSSIDTYEWKCINGEYYSKNDTYEQICSNIKTGTHNGWINYNLGTELETGTYEVKLEGSKKPSRTIDWIYYSQGEWLNAWAVWGNISAGDDAQVNLDSPADNYESAINFIEFNCSSKITSGVVLANISFWHNASGTWELNQTNIVEGIGGDIWTKKEDWTTTINDSTPRGIQFYVINNTRLKVVTKSSTTDATKMLLLDNNLVLISSASFIGNTATFNTATEDLTAGNYYRLEAWGEGIDFKQELTGGTPYPQLSATSGVINATTGSLNGTLNSGNHFNIENITFSNSIFHTNASFNISISEPTLWSCSACDTGGDCGVALENRTIGLDTDNPQVTINIPQTTEDIGYYNVNQTLNWSIVESNFDSAWYNYNGTNITIYGANNETSFELDGTDYNLTFWANDTLGNINETFLEWSYTLFVNNETYSAISYGSSFESFEINLNYDSSSWGLIEGSLWYNTTSYVGSDGASGDNAIFSTEIQIPTNASIVINPFYWTIALTNGTGTFYFNITEHNQTINPIVLQFCNATINTTTLNFTLKEAGTFDLLNGSLEATFNYWGGGDGLIYQTYSYTNQTDNNTNYAFCIDPIYAEFVTDATISYYKEGYDRREYLLSDYTLNNVTENINLYLTTTASTDIFTFTVRDENDDIVPGATIRIQRWDIGTNNFYTVGMVYTSADGTGIINMRLNDAWYRYQVLYNNILYLTTEPVKESSTSRTLNIDLATTNPYDQFEEIDYSLTYNNQTNVTIFTYADTTGAIQIGCLRVLEMTGLGNTEVYYSCVESTSGTLSYEINDSGTYIIRAIFRLTEAYDSVEKVIDEIIRQGTPERFTIIDKFGSVISLLLTGTSATIGIAAGSIPLGLGLIIASLIIVNLLGWLNITSTVLYGLLSIIILIALNLRRKR